MDKEVIIEVHGGIAVCTSKPDDITVIIRDYDTECNDTDENTPNESIYSA